METDKVQKALYSAKLLLLFKKNGPCLHSGVHQGLPDLLNVFNAIPICYEALHAW